MRVFGCSLLLMCCAVLPVQSASGYTFLNIPDRRDYVFDGAGILYISTYDGNILRYNTHSGTFLSPFNVGGNLKGIDLSLDGSTLAVADESLQGPYSRIVLVKTATGAATSVSFVRDRQEAGTYMVAWGKDDQILITSDFAGSGLTPLRRYNSKTGTTIILRSLSQSGMLTPSADRKTIATVESNVSSALFSAYDVQNGSFGADDLIDRFTFEIAVDRDGDKFVVPTGFGAYVYNRSGSSFVQQTIIGDYFKWGPSGAVFSPVHDLLFTSEWTWSEPRGVRVYNTDTMSLLTTIDSYPFEWIGRAMTSGRMEISPDGNFLAVSIDNGVRLYDVSAYVPEPSSITYSIGIGAFLLYRRRK